MTVTSLSLPATLAWLRLQAPTPVPESWVPGATALERQYLGALGSVAAFALGGEVPHNWPEDIRTWMRNPLELPPDVAAELELAIKEAPDETLATLYAQLVAGPRRRVLGTFFTPRDEVAAMLDLWAATQPAPTDVVDVGAGVGVFTAAAAERWPLARVTALDINPVTLGLLGARMAQPEVAAVAGRVELVQGDFTTWLPQQAAESGSRRLTLGNPPFTRGQLIEPVTRARLVEATKDWCGSRASLSAFITALSLKHLEPDDGLCLLLPAQWLESQYAAPLRQNLIDLHYRRVELHLVPEVLFDDATVDAVILMVGTQRETTQDLVVAQWREEGVPVDREDATSDGWRTWFATAPSEPATAQQHGRRLDDVAVVRRGVATGANSFFLLSAKMLVEHSLPLGALRRVVHRLKMFEHGVNADGFEALPDGERSWLFSANEYQARDPAVARYLKAGKDAGIADRYLCQDRTPWHDLSRDIVIPDVIVTAMSKCEFRIVANDAGAAITNNLYGLTWRNDTTEETRAEVLRWLRGTAGQDSIRAACRRQGDQLNKLEPRALASLVLPESLFD